MTDQEGGAVRRFRWAPPAASAEEMGRLGEAAIRRRGRDTATGARAPRRRCRPRPGRGRPGGTDRSSPPSTAASRSIPLPPRRTSPRSRRGCSTAAWRRPSSTFPGSGSRRGRPTTPPSRIGAAPTRTSRTGSCPYRRAIAAGVAPVVMISNAAYAAYGGRRRGLVPARAPELRKQGFDGVTVTDALEPLATPTASPWSRPRSAPPERASTSCSSSARRARRQRVFDALLAEARAGRLPRAALERSAARIDELAATYAG